MRNPVAAALAVILAVLCSSAAAQQKPVRILVGLAAGGSLDTMTRLPARDLAAKVRPEYEQIGRELRASGYKLQD